MGQCFQQPNLSQPTRLSFKITPVMLWYNLLLVATNKEQQIYNQMYQFSKEVSNACLLLYSM